MILQKNQIINITIESLSNDGNGVGRIDGMAVFVPFTAVGDEINVKIVKVAKTHAFGIIDEVLKPSADRITPECEIYSKCGGCCFGHISYEAELSAKETFVSDAMKRLGDIHTEVFPILASPQASRYRNKAQYPLTTQNGNIEYGFYAQRSHRVVPCKNCVLQPELLNSIADSVCKLLEEYNTTIYNEKEHKGLVRHIYLRHATKTNSVMVCLIVNGKKLPYYNDICKKLKELHPEISSVVINVNKNKTNVITGEKCITLYGNSVLNDTMCNVPVSLSPLSFYQVNTLGAEQLYKVAIEYADLKPNETLLDLYCGVGTIGLAMALATPVKSLIGVEIIPQAIESAIENAKACNITNARFLCSDAKDAAQSLSNEGLKPDVIVLDPPRKGCDEETLNAVVKMNPSKIVMVSCNPATAARDTKYLTEHNYKVTKIQPVDMFPRTKHVETCVLLSRVVPQNISTSE